MLHILENFVCVLYGSSRVKSIDDWRLQLLNKKFDYGETLEYGKSFDFSSLSSCRDSLHQHFKRVNYQVILFKLIAFSNGNIFNVRLGSGSKQRRTSLRFLVLSIMAG